MRASGKSLRSKEQEGGFYFTLGFQRLPVQLDKQPFPSKTLRPLVDII